MRILLIIFSLFLSSCKKNSKFEGEYLLKCSVFYMDRDRPIFLNTLEEGDIAFYGILLLQNKDPYLRNYLLNTQKDGIWEYQKNFGYTPVDAPWVVEALMNFGRKEDQQLIKKSLEQMFKIGWDEKSGSIIALFSGLSKYWFGPDIDGTAHLSYLLGKHDFLKYEKSLERMVNYVKENQLPSGLWKSKWYASNFLTTFNSIRALLLFPQNNFKNLNLAKRAILEAQLANGSFNNSVFETSLAILSFNELNCCSDKIKNAKDWLLKAEPNPTNPLLFYWFEGDLSKKFPEGERKFFDCWDKGKITNAFRNLALKIK